MIDLMFICAVEGNQLGVVQSKELCSKYHPFMFYYIVHILISRSIYTNKCGILLLLVFVGAFFDMYIGEIPVSEETKQEIGKNVASIMNRC